MAPSSTALNLRILETVNDTAHYFISTTRLNGALALRSVPRAFAPGPADIEGLIGEIREAAASV